MATIIRKKKKLRKIVYIFPLAIAVTFLVIELIGLSIEYSNMKRENATLELRIKEEEAITAELEETIEKLNDPNYLTSYAKENYLYTEDGTIIIRIPEDEDGDDD